MKRDANVEEAVSQRTVKPCISHVGGSRRMPSSVQSSQDWLRGGYVRGANGRLVPRTDHLPKFDLAEHLFKIPLIPARDLLGGTTFLLNCLQGGTIIYANTKGEVEDLCKSMLDSGVLQTGWDLEWLVDFRRGEKAGRVALMQICYQDPIKETYKCLLFHIKYTSITASLHAYLKNPAIVKTGVNARNDSQKMNDDFGIAVTNVVDLYHHPYVTAGRYQSTIPSCSLQGLTAQFLGKHLPKEAVRTGNWDQKPLSHDQQRYAASDALASLKVFEVVEKLQQQELHARQEAIMAGAAEPASEIEAGVTSVLPQDPRADFYNPAETVKVLGSGAELLKGPHEAGNREGAQPEAVYEVGPWLPAAQRCVRLSAAIQSVYNVVFQQGLSIGETARLRGIKSTTILGYLANAIFCGHAYPWPCAGVTQADIAKVTPVLEDLLKTAGEEEFAISRETGRRQLRLKTLSEVLDRTVDIPILRLICAHYDRQQHTH